MLTDLIHQSSHQCVKMQCIKKGHGREKRSLMASGSTKQSSSIFVLALLFYILSAQEDAVSVVNSWSEFEAADIPGLHTQYGRWGV